VHRTDFARSFLDQIKSASGRVGVDIRAVVVGGVDEFDSAFTAMAKERAGALVIQPLLATK
jgi:hypothetical protein